MRKVTDIYEQYRIPPQLQLHQLRVASVASMIVDAFEGVLERERIVTTCLFHDMGNIVKFNFDQFPDSFLGSKPRTYWEAVKAEFTAKYGTDAHEANLAIASELWLSEDIRSLMDGISFANLLTTQTLDSFEEKICEYADLRVGPYGVIPLEARIQDIHDRYSGGRSIEVPTHAEDFDELRAAAYEVERQIFSRARITPLDITDVSVAPLIEELKKYTIA